MSLEGAHTAAGGDLPEPQGIVPTSRECQARISAQAYGIDTARVSLEVAQTPSGDYRLRPGELKGLLHLALVRRFPRRRFQQRKRGVHISALQAHPRQESP